MKIVVALLFLIVLTVIATVLRAPVPIVVILSALQCWFLLVWWRRQSQPLEDAPGDFAPDWPLALATFDARGRLVRANEEFRALFALKSDAILLTQLLPPDDCDDVVRLLAQTARHEGRAYSEERQFFRADGTAFSGRWHVRSYQKQLNCWVENISPMQEAQHIARLSRQALRELAVVVAGSGALETRIGSLLELGRRCFDVETAFIGQTVENQLRILDVRSVDERIRRGQSYDLEGAQRDGELVRPRGPRGLVHGDFGKSRAVKMSAAPATILSAPILVEEEIWATLTFSAAEARPAFQDDDGQFLMLMAGWLGGELERRQSRAQLEAQQIELLKAADALERLATHDGLTDLKNRRALDEQLEAEFQRARRYQTPLSMILLDVDKFKSFNDSFGHPSGDEVLKSVGQILGGSVRNIDFAARYGGEEFALLLPNTDRTGALILAERLREKVETYDWEMRAITASFGVATVNATISDAKQLLQCADEALYQAKETGRNRVTHHDALQVPAE